MADTQDTRRYERIDIQLRCRLFIPEIQEGKKPHRLRFEAFASSLNLGLRGLFVRSDFLLKPGVDVTVELGLPNGPLSIVSRVAHIVGLDSEDHPSGMGLEILDVDAHGRETLLRYFTPPQYEAFHARLVREFPHLASDFALDDVSLLVNLWEETKASEDGQSPTAARRTPRR